MRSHRRLAMLLPAFLVLGLGLCGSLFAQSGTSTAGKDLSNSGVQWSFTLGQPFHLGLGSGTQAHLNQGIQQTYQDNKVLGFLRYDNTAQTALTNCQVRLLNNQAAVVASTITNASGAYEISQFPDGVYTLGATTTKPWGGVNATDALRVRQFFTGTAPLVGLRLKAGDVNNTNSVNSNDALLITRRFSNLVTSFNVGDWAFEAPTLTANGQTQTLDFKGLIYGDVNASYVPSNLRQPVRLVMEYNALVSEESNGTWVPVTTGFEGPVSALSLVAGIPAGLEILDVRSSLPPGDLSWSCHAGEFRLGWSDVVGIVPVKGQPLFEILLRGSSEAPWVPRDLSEMAGPDGEPYPMADLRLPKVISKSGSWQAGLYPNPAGEFSTLDLHFTSGVDHVNLVVYDSRGRLVWALNRDGVPSGLTRIELPVEQWSEGRYMVRVGVVPNTTNTILPSDLARQWPLVIRR
ncbi:MAG: T9SS C-terminal target domain-containing protein [Cytophagia bacterium]|nr:T9SS C-terminal target domain-containing protein [Cytophagia bacterium]